MRVKNYRVEVLLPRKDFDRSSVMSIPGSNVRLFRRQLNLSLRTLSEATGVDESSLSRLENGKGGYSAEGIQRIAEALHVSLGVLFSEPETVEAAALRTREVPILTADQLAEWRGAESLEFTITQEYAYFGIRDVSRHAFGWRVADSANAPTFRLGDVLIFEATEQPAMGDVVLAQDGDRRVTLGRLRVPVDQGQTLLFDVVPHDTLYLAASKRMVPSLELRGKLVESRRRH